MPARHAQACKVLGCAQVAPCPQHGPVATRVTFDRARGSAAARGYDRHWRAFTDRYFGQLYALKVPRAGLCGGRHPAAPETADSLCAAAGVSQLATLVDHIVPITGKADRRRFDLSNLQGLCDRCHNQKRQRESTQAKRRA